MPEPIEIDCDGGFEDEWGGECGCGWGWDDSDGGGTGTDAMVACFSIVSVKYWINSLNSIRSATCHLVNARHFENIGN